MTAALSVQLYSVRDALAADLPGTLDRIAGLGFANRDSILRRPGRRPSMRTRRHSSAGLGLR
ncbi:hypothetical protein O1R50_12640 [Glycomyces luteolus]|uniref:Uncharacterized protein n=1 Tax=Glycomyces luteolus TaxID=2670330 RepID=A0A9X3SQG1_9ACTN|nr:hypothetical protein [Glycomyces luteolus]MDA1360477.1 hypothetical protein [Glycomyces luteolus]